MFEIRLGKVCHTKNSNRNTTYNYIANIEIHFWLTFDTGMSQNREKLWYLCHPCWVNLSILQILTRVLRFAVIYATWKYVVINWIRWILITFLFSFFYHNFETKKNKNNNTNSVYKKVPWFWRSREFIYKPHFQFVICLVFILCGKINKLMTVLVCESNRHMLVSR